MKIEVTAKDIKLGIKTPNSNIKCPVARALRRAGFKQLLVGTYTVHAKQKSITLSEKTTGAIQYMCATNTMTPFNFTLTKKQVAILNGN